MRKLHAGRGRLRVRVKRVTGGVGGRRDAATVARLQDNPQFRADLDAARTEIAAARAQGLRPAKDCAAEAETLQVRPASAL